MDTPYELQIDARCRTWATVPTSLADFEVTRGAPVEVSWLVQNPQVSLYCLDAATSQAIFVEVAPEVNLVAAPFVRNAQYEGAQRLFTMPYPQLFELADKLETRLDRLILLHNISRCGSTLLHQVFNQVPGVVSLSEPDAFIPYLSYETRLPDSEASALMKATAKVLFRPQLFPDRVVAVIKFRGVDLRLLDLCHVTFPNATLLFQYRDAMSWAASWMRVTHVEQVLASETMPLEEFIAILTSVFGVISLDDWGLGRLSGPLSRAKRLALFWVAIMDYYLQHVNRGFPITAWRYADVNQRRQETLTRLFATCGLPLDTVQLALAGFERDSQAGTVLARAEESQGNPIRLTHEQEEEIRALVRCHPLIQTTDFVAPGIIASSGSLET